MPVLKMQTRRASSASGVTANTFKRCRSRVGNNNSSEEEERGGGRPKDSTDRGNGGQGKIGRGKAYRIYLVRAESDEWVCHPIVQRDPCFGHRSRRSLDKSQEMMQSFMIHNACNGSHDHRSHALRQSQDAAHRHPPPDRRGHAEPLLLGGAPICFGCVCPPRCPTLRHRCQRRSSHRLSGCRCPQVSCDELPGSDISTPGAYERPCACCIPLPLPPDWILLPSLWQMLPHVAFITCPHLLSRPYCVALCARCSRHEIHSLGIVFELPLGIVAAHRSCRIEDASQARATHAPASIRRVLICPSADPVVDCTVQQTTQKKSTAEGG